MSRINRLTPEQEATFPSYVDEWLRVGLSTETDRCAAEAAVRKAYECAGLKPPAVVVWLRSPLEGAVGSYMLSRVWDQVRAQVMDRVRDQVRTQVMDQVWDHVWDQVMDQVMDRVGDHVWDRVGDHVWAQVRDQVWDEVLAQVRDQVRDQVRTQVWDKVWDKVWDQVGAQVRDQVWNQVLAQVWNQVRDQVGNQVIDQVRAQVRAQVLAQVWNQVRDQVMDQVMDRVGDHVWDQVGDHVWTQVGDQVMDRVRDQVRTQVMDQVGDQVMDRVRDHVWVQVWDQVWDQVGDQVWNQVRVQVWDHVWDQVRDQVWDQVGRACYGSHDASWLAFYKYFNDNGIEMPMLEGLWEVARHCGWWWPFRGAVILTPKPFEVHLRDGVLHHDGGPAIRYEDGFSVWALRGVRVPQWLAETPAHEIDPSRFMEIQNAEVRREFVRKVDVARVFDRAARIIDTQGDYALGEFEVVYGQPRRYLKMLNPSVPGVWHIEAVHPSCATVAEALNWRRYGNKQTTWAPSQLS